MASGRKAVLLEYTPATTLLKTAAALTPGRARQPGEAEGLGETMGIDVGVPEVVLVAVGVPEGLSVWLETAEEVREGEVPAARDCVGVTLGLDEMEGRGPS